MFGGLSKTSATLAVGLALSAVAFLSTQACSSTSLAFPDQEEGSGSAAQRLNLTQQETAPFAFIELFTSQGCSSCPSADQNLARIAKESTQAGKNVYTLSYHVDYWDYLGWKDPYGSEAFSNRQRRYAQQLESDRVYTPQMIVNGQVEFVGSRTDASNKVVEAALELPVNASVQADAFIKEGEVHVDFYAKGLGERDHVLVALVQKKGTQKVSRGENARRELSHVNIVRSLKAGSDAQATGNIQFETPDEFTKEGYHVVTFVQSPSAVIAATSSQIADKPSQAKVMPQQSLQQVSTQRVVAAKPAIPDQATAIGVEKFLGMLTSDPQLLRANLAEVEQNWHVSYVPMLIEVARFLPTEDGGNLIRLLESKTGNQFGFDFDKWFQWNWKQQYEQYPEYGDFKSQLYSQLDPRFAEYFAVTAGSKIRLDEIRWGGVRRDGIPPLKNPKMLSANEAGFLADTDVVFGIELNGDARAYPKRILAWHEMFKDTIGGESVCGVY